MFGSRTEGAGSEVGMGRVEAGAEILHDKSNVTNVVRCIVFTQSN